MSFGEVLALLAAGAAAGTINTVVGSGSMVTFPVLLALGYTPVVANVTNTVGLVPGSLAGVVGYRRELGGQRKRIVRFVLVAVVGATAGAALLLSLPASAFDAIVPAFVALALLLVLLQPRLARRVQSRRSSGGGDGPLTAAAVFATSVYGGYFSAAQGILLLAVLGLALPEDLQRVNALKNVLQLTVNVVSALVFVLVADVAWSAAGLMAIGAVAGGLLGARYGRRLSPQVLRAVVVVVGVAALVLLLG
jgi:uncharacterized membrane protein YfcA